MSAALGVAAVAGARDVLVDRSLVLDAQGGGREEVGERRVHVEGHCEGAVGVELIHDGLHALRVVLLVQLAHGLGVPRDVGRGRHSLEDRPCGRRCGAAEESAPRGRIAVDDPLCRACGSARERRLACICGGRTLPNHSAAVGHVLRGAACIGHPAVVGA